MSRDRIAASGQRARPSRRTVVAGLAALAAPALLGARPTAAQGLAREAGTLLLLGFSGSTLDAASARALRAQLAAGNAGGALFLGPNVGSRASVLALARAFRDGAADGLPALVAVDQEGGTVQRLGPALGFTDLPRALDVAGTMTADAATRLYARTAGELRDAGFTLNLAPVADLHDAENPVIGRNGRAFAADPATVARYAGAVVAAHRAAGIATALKHFPGHGTSRGDTHEGTVDISATWRRADELAPFAELIRGGMADMVMVAHVSHPAFGPNPATLSPAAIGASAGSGILRGELRYAGPAITDDLDMAAIRDRYGLEQAVVLALAAGCDLLLLSNSLTPDPELPARAVGWITAAVAAGRLPAARVAEAAARVRALRTTIARATPLPSPRPAGAPSLEAVLPPPRP